MDIYYRLLALHRAGVRITLHCFTYGRAKAPELETCCEQVYYYRRNMSPTLHLHKIPFVAASRDSDELLERLSQDDAPVLIEGVHGCELLRRLREREAGQERRRRVVVRAHNVERDYYRMLARSERRPLRKIYLALEACKLRRYESVLTLADAVCAITDADAAVFRQMGCAHVFTVPPFFSPIEQSEQSSGDCSSQLPIPSTPYMLFHADLSVPDNEWAVRWLQRHVMHRTAWPFVVAGRNPRASLCRFLSHFPNTTLVVSPTQSEMDALVSEARCTVMITRQPTGFKLKLINSLVRGQHCLVNSAMVAGTNLAVCCHVSDTPDEMRQQLDQLMQTPFDDALRQQRQSQLNRMFDPEARARQIVELL